MRTHALVAATVFIAAAVPARAQVSQPRNASVSAEGATRIDIEAGAGILRVMGRPGQRDVRVEGTARASDSKLLERIRLVAERVGDAVHVKADIDEDMTVWNILSLIRGGGWGALDLVISVPAALAVKATDGSGDAEFRGVGTLDLHDGSGSLLVQDVAGEVAIVDGSGEIVVRNVIGPLQVTDGSGSITVGGIGRDLSIRDGSGEIVVRNAGNVRVLADGSGSIDVSDAAGWVRVDVDGSGTISVRDVGGDFTVGRKGSGSVSHAAVRGRVTVPTR